MLPLQKEEASNPKCYFNKYYILRRFYLWVITLEEYFEGHWKDFYTNFLLPTYLLFGLSQSLKFSSADLTMNPNTTETNGHLRNNFLQLPT